MKALQTAVQRALSAWDTTTLKTNGDGMLSEAMEFMRAEFDAGIQAPEGDDLAAAAAALVQAVQRDWPGAPTHRAEVLAAADKVSAALAAQPVEKTGAAVELAGVETGQVKAPAEGDLTDERCDSAIQAAGLWTLALVVPENLAMLRRLCRVAVNVQPKGAALDMSGPSSGHIGSSSGHSAAQAPAPAPEHVPVSPEHEVKIDDALGLVLLPPIRVDRATHAALMESCKATGKIIQAVVRDRLAPYAIPCAAVTHDSIKLPHGLPRSDAEFWLRHRGAIIDALRERRLFIGSTERGVQIMQLGTIEAQSTAQPTSAGALTDDEILAAADAEHQRCKFSGEADSPGSYLFGRKQMVKFVRSLSGPKPSAPQVEMECERCGLPPEKHVGTHWCDNQSFRVVESKPPVQGERGMKLDHRDGTEWVVATHSPGLWTVERLSPIVSFRIEYINSKGLVSATRSIYRSEESARAALAKHKTIPSQGTSPTTERT